MSIRNYVEELEFQESLGMDTTSPLSALVLKPGWCVDASNYNLGLEGGYIKRDGYSNVLTGSVWSTNSITGGIEFTSAGGSRQIVVFGTTGSTGSIGTVSAGAVTSAKTSLSATARPGFVNFRDIMLFFNGVDTPQTYDGTSFRQIGITPPSSAPTVGSQTTGGSLTIGGSYVWAYTYYNSVTKAESSPSPSTASTTLTASNNEVPLTLVAGSSSTADTIRIWRTSANGTQLFLEGTASISATSFTSSASDASLTTALEIDNSQIATLASGSKYPKVADNRVFIVSGKNQVRWSKIGQSGAMPESYQVNAVVDTMGQYGDNDPIVGLGSAYGSFGYYLPSNTLIVVKSQSFGRLQRINQPDPTNPSDGVFYTYNEISDKVGGVSHWGICQVENECVFLSRDNIYATDGWKVRAIANPIQSTIKALGFTSSQTPLVSSINDVKNKRVLFSVFINSAATVPQYILVGDYRKYPDFRWTWYTPGQNGSSLPGIQPGCFFHITDSSDGSQDVYFGNTVNNGKLYELNSGTNSDDGSGIYAQLKTRPYAFTKPINIKLFKDARINVLGSGAAYNLTMTAIFDLNNTEVNSQSFSLQAMGAVYGTGLYGSAIYAEPDDATEKYTLHRKAQYMQLIFRNSDSNAPITLYSWGLTGSLTKVF